MLPSFFQTKFFFTWVKAPLLLVVPLLLLNGCAKYKAMPLRRAAHRVSDIKQAQSITLTSIVYNKSDCKAYLDRDVIARGYQPIQISLVNNSRKRLQFCIHNFSLPTVYYDEVADLVFTSTTRRVLGYGITGLFIWPFLIPAVVDGIGSSRANEKLEKDFERKTLNDQIIKPYTIIEGLIFVPLSSFHTKFTLTVFDLENHKPYVLSAPTTHLVFE